MCIDVLFSILHAFRTFEEEGKLDVLRWELNFKKLCPKHQAILSHLPAKYDTIKECLRQNQTLLNQLVASVGMTEDSRDDDTMGGPSTSTSNGSGGRVSAMDVEKVRYVLKDLVREWSAEGSVERSQSYDKIVKLLCECFPDVGKNPELGTSQRPKVLIPGCGLRRLVLEVASKGFRVEGNEFSYYMLFTSAFMMNYATRKNQWCIYPYVLQSCNVRTDQDQCRGVHIPDVCASDGADMVISPDQMSICGGDFVEVYGRPEAKGKWDAVITCFFLDTAPNFLTYLEVIAHALKDGGVWINLGPLLWHWAGQDELSIEVSLEDIERGASFYGFKTEWSTQVLSEYTSNMKSMSKNTFNCEFSLRKKQNVI